MCTHSMKVLNACNCLVTLVAKKQLHIQITSNFLLFTYLLNAHNFLFICEINFDE